MKLPPVVRSVLRSMINPRLPNLSAFSGLSASAGSPLCNCIGNQTCCGDANNNKWCCDAGQPCGSYNSQCR